MDKTTLSLVTALVDTQDANLYNDIYFPIIKYCVVELYYNGHRDGRKIFSIQELHSVICEKFGVSIPQIVLQHCIINLKKYPIGIDITPIDNGKQFCVNKELDISLNAEMDVKSFNISEGFERLESCFKKYLEAEQITSTKSFVDFYTDNTDEVITYLRDDNADSSLSAEYANLARFIIWIKEYDKALYSLIDDIFFAALVAGFLQRTKVDPAMKTVEKVEYYLDTALILSLLGLSNEDSITYAQELVEVIKDSGSIPKIHAITIREIKNILDSVVANQGPWPGSAMEEGYKKQNYTPSKLLLKKNTFVSDLEQIGIVVTTKTEAQLYEIETSYRNKSFVKQLEEQRGGPSNGIRDIHDVFMKDFIDNLNKDIASIEKVKAHFVTINSDFIKLCKSHGRSFSVIHSAKVITNLWMHSARSKSVRGSALTLMVSRCFVLNKQDVRVKLNTVLRNYGELGDISDHDAGAIYKALLLRSNRVMSSVDKIIENEESNPEHAKEENAQIVKQIIQISIEEHNQRINSIAELDQLKSEIGNITEEVKSIRSSLSTRERELDEEKKRGQERENEIKRAEQSAIEQKAINTLYGRISKLNDEIIQLQKENVTISNDIQKEEKELDQYIKKEDHHKIYYMLEVLLIIWFFASIAYGIYFYIKFESFSVKGLISALTPLATLLIALTRKKLYIIDGSNIHDNQLIELTKNWKEMNPEYGKSKSLLEANNERISKLEKEIQLIKESIPSA